MNNEALILACIKGDRKAQFALYQQLASMLHVICKRYLKSSDAAEDALAESFVIIFNKIESLKEPEALYGWAKRIAVNHCLQILRRQVSFHLSIDDIKQEPVIASNASQTMEYNELLKLLDYLPDGCRSVFNLFVIEGFSHKEIADELQISEGTSKSQLNVARIKLQKMIPEHYQLKLEENGIAK